MSCNNPKISSYALVKQTEQGPIVQYTLTFKFKGDFAQNIINEVNHRTMNKSFNKNLRVLLDKFVIWRFDKFS